MQNTQPSVIEIPVLPLVPCPFSIPAPWPCSGGNTGLRRIYAARYSTQTRAHPFFFPLLLPNQGNLSAFLSRGHVNSSHISQSVVVLRPYLIDRHSYIVHVVFCLLDGRFSVALPPPALDILSHFVPPTLLFLDLVAELAIATLIGRIIHKLQPASLACAIFFRALLPEVSPLPVATLPASLLEVTHVWSGSARGWWYKRGLASRDVEV